jgi:hypothetical protein
MRVKLVKNNLIISVPIKKIKELIEVKEALKEALPDLPEAIESVVPPVETPVNPVIE